MKDNSVLIISNYPEIGKDISNKLKLLRNYDKTSIVSYIDSIAILKSIHPNIILIYCSRKDTLNIIKEIKSINNIEKVPIIFITDDYEEDKLLYAFEEGIDDFFFLTDSDEIILMRIILNIQKSVLYKKIDMQERALTVSNILDKKSKIILRDTGEIVLKEIFSQIFEEEIDNAYIMYLKVLGAKDDNIDSDYISDIIRKLTRKNDITAYDKTSGFYLILYNTDENGIKIIFNKIYEILKSNYKIYACTARITTSFEQIELRLYEGIEKQLETNTIYKYIPEIDEEDIKSLFDSKEINQINSEISKKEFLQNLESITAPVFYRIQTNYNDKLKNTKIKYVFSEDKIKFIISGEENMSELVITYPDNIRIIADTRHYIKNIEPQVKRFIYNTNEISEEKIVFLLENMIKEYLNNSILDKLYITE